jgi:predicted signal transduction protein with EAL and GGDEF domain
VIIDAFKINPILQVVEKTLAVVSEPYRVTGREIFSSCSIGVSVYPNDGTDAGSLLKNADTAMYTAKGSGRNRFQLYDAAMNAMAEERLQLETELHYAGRTSSYSLPAPTQPQTGRIEGVEARFAGTSRIRVCSARRIPHPAGRDRHRQRRTIASTGGLPSNRSVARCGIQ